MSLAQLASNLSQAERRVESLVAKYRATGYTYHPKISQICPNDEDYDMVWTLLDHEAQLIGQRPTGLAFHEISVIQKAFLTLFGDKNLIPAMNLYVCEILGLGDSDKTNEDITLSVQKRLYLSYQLKEAHREERGTSQAAPETHVEPEPNPPKERLPGKFKRTFILTSGGQQEGPEKATQHTETTQGESTEQKPDERLARLLKQFQEAKSEFDAARPKSFQQTRSARFLRDTSENCLNYLRSKHAIESESKTIPSDTELGYDKDVVAELFNVLAEATRVAERGSGGKKRRFDITDEERAAAVEAQEAREAREKSKERRYAEDYYNNPQSDEYRSEGELEEENRKDEYDPRKPYLVDTRDRSSRRNVSPRPRGRGRDPRPDPRPAPAARISAHVAANEEARYRVNKPRRRARAPRYQRSVSPPDDRHRRDAPRRRDGPFVPVPEREEDRRGMGYAGRSSRYRPSYHR